MKFLLSFGFRKNFLIYFIFFLEAVHRLDIITCYIKNVARTHISISFITLGDFREEVPTPSKIWLRRLPKPFLLCFFPEFAIMEAADREEKDAKRE